MFGDVAVMNMNDNMHQVIMSSSLLLVFVDCLTLSIISSYYMWQSIFLLYCQLLIIAYIRLLIIVLN